MSRKSSDIGTWGASEIAPGERKRLRLEIGKNFSGSSVTLPLMVWRAPEDGPVVGITAAVHGDEINGTGAIRRLIQEPPFTLTHGTLILVPVVNIMGFERHSRYMPDRRDLNRCFPGSLHGSLSSRLARAVFDQVVGRCDYLIDLHTAAVRRTNFPNVRTDFDEPECARLARAFGCEVIVNSAGPDGSLRKAAVKSGCPTIVLEAGEVWKVEPSVQELTLRGISNVLAELQMTGGVCEPPPHQVIVRETRWIRSESGGFLHFHVAPGDAVAEGQAVASSTNLLGSEMEIIRSPLAGVVMGMTTMPAVGPGDPVVHIALPSDAKQQLKLEKSIDNLDSDTIEIQLREHLATNIVVNVLEENS
ncbi:succinylglutamate desuccinylase/aspartoacylase family protein [Luteolibacter pohnpeiensis]|uniref:Succinylglutamate desuccinylase/aspartoacylase family protein n=1 Tax=Luteolibacter pohnpeiensis TaxID=454153 RepID=A0A934SBC0_9BACT|nr:succinylglutamate desuccinylase/aspartoacylase family protein [Luteolibacter pohnpeiensis]MBK1882168.1 succinylglutamate desuccinylase/aspartoacylase family protein [Luteolibacter pohnpeiensis]